MESLYLKRRKSTDFEKKATKKVEVEEVFRSKSALNPN